MTVKLELMEIVWLQNIKRKPGEYSRLWDAGEIQEELLSFGLIEFRKVDDENVLFITKTGDEILRQHLPISSNWSLRPPISSYETRGGERKKV